MEQGGGPKRTDAGGQAIAGNFQGVEEHTGKQERSDAPLFPKPGKEEDHRHFQKGKEGAQSAERSDASARVLHHIDKEKCQGLVGTGNQRNAQHQGKEPRRTFQNGGKSGDLETALLCAVCGRFRMDTVMADALRRDGQEEEEAVTQQEQGKGVQHLQEIAEQQGSQRVAQRPEPPGEAEVDFHTFPPEVQIDLRYKAAEHQGQRQIERVSGGHRETGFAGAKNCRKQQGLCGDSDEQGIVCALAACTVDARGDEKHQSETNCG